MKIKILAIVAACMSVLTASAQETNLNKYFKVDNSQFSTFFAYGEDYSFQDEYVGEGYRCGMQSLLYQFIGEDTKEDITVAPLDTLTALFTMTDMYGTEHARVDNSQEILKSVNQYLKRTAKSFYKTISNNFTVIRGGVYTLRHYMDFIDYDWRNTITICDDPTLRILGQTVVKTGEGVSFRAFYNTGYPFDINSLTGNETTTVTLYRHLSDSTSEEVFTHMFPLDLKDEEHPLIAGIDSIAISYVNPKIGAYTIRFETDWDAIGNRDVSMSVEDTLRASVSLDKEAYVLPTDKKARLGIKMDYGYPHIYPAKPDIIPTIRISALLMQKADTLLCDSMKLANDTLQTKDLLYDNAWELDLTKIDQSKLDDNAAEKKLYVTIHFNGTEQYNAVIPLTIQPTATGISSVSATGEDEEAVYTLSGMRLNPKGKLPAGVYIRNGKKIVVKQ